MKDVAPGDSRGGGGDGGGMLRGRLDLLWFGCGEVEVHIQKEIFV